jgi:hypothetical protein
MPLKQFRLDTLKDLDDGRPSKRRECQEKSPKRKPVT